MSRYAARFGVLSLRGIRPFGAKKDRKSRAGIVSFKVLISAPSDDSFLHCLWYHKFIGRLQHEKP